MQNCNKYLADGTVSTKSPFFRLNLHHEEPYQNRSTLGADYEEISGYVTSLWGQLAETFKDYDQRLIFETMNEPRAKETDHEWWGPTNEEVDTIN